MQKNRNLSGIYFFDKDTKPRIPVCFEELSSERQKEVLKDKSREFLISLSQMLGRTLRDIGDQFDLTKEIKE